MVWNFMESSDSSLREHLRCGSEQVEPNRTLSPKCNKQIRADAFSQLHLSKLSLCYCFFAGTQRKVLNQKQALAGTIQLERVNTVWRACGDETKSSSRTSTRGGPNGAPAN
jgi:hypothetical protein